MPLFIDIIDPSYLFGLFSLKNTLTLAMPLHVVKGFVSSFVIVTLTIHVAAALGQLEHGYCHQTIKKLGIHIWHVGPALKIFFFLVTLILKCD